MFGLTAAPWMPHGAALSSPGMMSVFSASLRSQIGDVRNFSDGIYLFHDTQSETTQRQEGLRLQRSNRPHSCEGSTELCDAFRCGTDKLESPG